MLDFVDRSSSGRSGAVAGFVKQNIGHSTVVLGLNSESGLGLGLELGCIQHIKLSIQYIKLLIQYIKLLIQYTINWVALYSCLSTKYRSFSWTGIRSQICENSNFTANFEKTNGFEHQHKPALIRFMYLIQTRTTCDLATNQFLQTFPEVGRRLWISAR